MEADNMAIHVVINCQLGLGDVGGQERWELNLFFSWSTILVQVPTSLSQCDRDFYSQLAEYET